MADNMEPVIPKPYQGIEECQFCDAKYHPMLRWSRGGTVITVCDSWYHVMVGNPDPKCADQARAAGFEPRPDKTPSR